jgi:predicted MFS family arabinose efflux permease
MPLGYLRMREFRGVLLTLCVLLATFMGGSIVVPLLLSRRYGYDLTLITYIAAARPVGFSIGSWRTPRLRQRLGPYRTQVLATGMLTVSSTLLVVAAGHHVLPLLVAAFVLTGLAAGTAHTSVLTSVNELAAGADIGIANGVASMVGTIGGAVGVTVLSTMIGDSHAAGPFVASFVVVTSLCAVTVVTSMLSVSRGGRRVERVTAPSSPAR